MPVSMCLQVIYSWKLDCTTGSMASLDIAEDCIAVASLYGVLAPICPSYHTVCAPRTDILQSIEQMRKEYAAKKKELLDRIQQVRKPYHLSYDCIALLYFWPRLK